MLVDHRDRPFQSTYVAQENIVRPNSPNAPGGSSSSIGTDFESEVSLVFVVSRVWYVMITILDRLCTLARSLAGGMVQHGIECVVLLHVFGLLHISLMTLVGVQNAVTMYYVT